MFDAAFMLTGGARRFVSESPTVAIYSKPQDLPGATQIA
jgi:hypothetical protein